MVATQPRRTLMQAAQTKRISISEVARRLREPGNVGVGMTKAGVKADFEVYDYIKSREQTHRIVGLDEDPMDTMTAAVRPTPLNRWRSLCTW